MNRILGIVILSAMAVLGSIPAAWCAPNVGTTAPDFSLADQGGKQVKSEDLKGKIVVLEWTNPECPFVKRHYQAGTMKKLAQSYSDKGVVWLAINSTHYMNIETNKNWASAQELHYQVLSDAAGAVGKKFDATTTPFMVIIDAQGKIAYSGAVDNDPYGDKKDGIVNYVAQALDELLANKPVSLAQTKSYGCSVKYAS